MNVLLIGGGGREHALATGLYASRNLDELYCAPGNAGIADIATCVELDVTNHDSVITFCHEKNIGFVVIGPEAALVDGLGDSLDKASIAYFGPTQAAAALEGSKGFTKDLCRDVGIPTAAYGRFNDVTSALAYLDTQPLPTVIKADGLAAGKGVVIATTKDDAVAAVTACFDGAFGAAGGEVVIEEFLDGEEASFFALSDGKTVIPLATAQDHKRVGDRDTGPNTGGMGAYSPAPVMSADLIQTTMDDIIKPTIAEMARRGTHFRGVLFAGLMITDSGPKLIEYNVRFGDPETQVIIARMQSDLLAALQATTNGTLDQLDLQWSDKYALTVVMAANGYPGTPQKGTEIRGIAAASAVDHVQIFHAGTRRDDQRLIANGGRVLCITALGPTVTEAQAFAYAALNRIDWPEGFARSDIGWRAILREAGSAPGTRRQQS